MPGCSATWLHARTGTLGAELRANELLDHLQQRATAGGRPGILELPAYQEWLQRPVEERHRTVRGWLEPLEPARAAIDQCLTLVRDAVDLSPLEAPNGFYEQGLDNGRGIQLLRVRMPPDTERGRYPAVDVLRSISRSLPAAASAEETFERLSQLELKDFKLGLIHGRMDAAEKDSVMTRFARGRLDVLIATSVVEVGVDVPNATLMTIESAERFGLAQLHQLRGRVSRGKHAGYVCAFPSRAARETEQPRLEAFANVNDGFQLAEIDFNLRGPGDLFSTRQHGLPPLRIADLARDAEVLEEARRDAAALLHVVVLPLLAVPGRPVALPVPTERERDLQQRQRVLVGLPLVGDVPPSPPLVGVEFLVDRVTQFVRALGTEFCPPVVDLPLDVVQAVQHPVRGLGLELEVLVVRLLADLGLVAADRECDVHGST